MRLFRAASLRAADAAAAAAGVPTTTLMHRAGLALAEAALRRWPQADRVLVACGPGNNGGDGYVVAQALAAAGRAVTVAELRPGAAKGDAGWARERLRASGVEVRWLPAGSDRGSHDGGGDPVPELPLAEHDLVIDALFGTGLSRGLEGTAARWIEAINAAGRPVLAVDVPSGVDADRAVSPGPAVRATLTVQLAGAVPASLLAPAREAFGETRVVPIGIPEHLLDAHADALAVDDAWLRAHAPRRPADAHKYAAGTVLVVGGSHRYAGAPELSARGAYRAGAGLVTLIAPERAPGAWPEVVWEPRAVDETLAAAVQRVLRGSGGERRATAALLGPGLEVAPGELARTIEALPCPMVLDAGALHGAVRSATRTHGGAVLTPHAGEAQRLLRALAEDDRDEGDRSKSARTSNGGLVPDARRDPLAAALRLARAWHAVCVLKGPGTVIADPDGRWTISAAGTSALASGGTGDVLAGVIAAFLAAAHRATADDVAIDAWSVCAAAVHLHGLAGRVAAERGPGIVASDVAEALPTARRRHG